MKPTKPVKKLLQNSSVQPVSAALIMEDRSIQPDGNTRAGVRFAINDGWHIYAEKPGEAGLPTTVTWTVPQHVKMEPVQYPLAQQLLDPGDLKTFGYVHQAILWSRLNAQGASGAIPIHATAHWLACRDICIPGQAELDASLPVSNEPPQPSSDAQRFE